MIVGLLTLVGEGAEEISANHVHGGLEDPLLDYVVGRLGQIKQVNQLNQALPLLLLQLGVLLRVTEVSYAVARSQLREV